MTESAVASQVDGDKLAEGFRRVTPFMHDEKWRDIHSVYVESHGGTLEMTTTDGYRMAHLTLDMEFPEGDWVLEGDGVKDFSQRHYSGEIQVEVVENGLKLGDVVVALVDSPYPNYRGAKPETFDTMAIVETRKWIKAIRQHGAEVVGVVYSDQGCRMYFQKDGETTGHEDLPVMMFSGPEKKIAYKAEYLRRSLTSCGRSATVKVGDPKRATLLEVEGYWHLLMPSEGFPREVNLSDNEREALNWAQDALQAVRKGEVSAKVLMGGGRFYLELRDETTETEILLETPELVTEGGTPPSAVVYLTGKEG